MTTKEEELKCFICGAELEENPQRDEEESLDCGYSDKEEKQIEDEEEIEFEQEDVCPRI